MMMPWSSSQIQYLTGFLGNELALLLEYEFCV